MISSKINLGFIAACLLFSRQSWGQDPCTGGYPRADKLAAAKAVLDKAYLSVGADFFSYEDGGVRNQGTDNIVGLRRKFVGCFSRLVQSFDDGSISPILALTDRANEIASETRVSGWGFEDREGSRRLLRDLAELLRQDGALRQRCKGPAPRFFEITDRMKIDPSITFTIDGDGPVQEEVLVTKYSSRECPTKGVFSEVRFGDGYESRAFSESASKICRMAKNPCIRAIERFPILQLRGHILAAPAAVADPMSCASDIEEFPFDGAGQVAGIIDQPLDSAHCAFADWVPVGRNHRKIVFDGGSGNLGPPTEARFHGTTVAGLLAGDPPNSEPTVRGAAPKAKIAFSPLFGFDSQRIKLALSRLYAEEARVFSISWGDDRCLLANAPCLLGALSRAFDKFASDQEEALVISAVSNAKKIALPENGRNVLAVAASGGKGRECKQFRGAEGPASSSQWKPELLSRGCRVKAAVPGSGCEGDFAPPALDPMTGMPFPEDCATSWAAPNLAGSALQLRQFLTGGCFLVTGCLNYEVCRPSAAQLKSLLVAGGTLSERVVPGEATGWGLPNPGRVAKEKEPILLVDVLTSPANRQDLKYALTDQSWVGPYNISLKPGETEVTLAWTGPAYGPRVSWRIVEDLDLIVVAKKSGWSVGVFVGNWPDRLKDADDLMDHRDRVNPIERILIPRCLEADQLEIYIFARKVVPKTLITGFQGYALSVTGAVKKVVGPGRSGRCETTAPLLPKRPPLPVLPFVAPPACP